MYDAVLIVSFGGPEKHEDVLPFLENVTRGRNVPRERLLQVAEHYYHFGGRSPLNDQCRELISALRAELDAHGMNLPIYWGNRNWRPFLTDAVRQMRDDGIQYALAFVTSAYSSYSGCRQYREDIAAALSEIEGGPKIDKLRVFYNHPGFIEASADRVRKALEAFLPNELDRVRFVISAHSIPRFMAQTSDYERQLRETSRLVSDAVGFTDGDLVFQSRSGPAGQAWLGPEILEHLRNLHEQGINNVLVAPLGFVSEHMEVLYDLDTEALGLANELGMKMVRAATVGTHPAFIKMIRQLIAERIFPNEPKLAVGSFGPNHDVCPEDCCPAPQRVGRSLVSEGPLVSRRS
ncbi:MAG: ferrochelatase [Acidobacteriaceae bacterium]|nr:ferrochelatase [Acidobacteriaceae bacterium]MBV9296210.1 ferrochelatase [Acidobacteriaceae bacterium]